MEVNLANRGLFSFDGAKARAALVSSTKPHALRPPSTASSSSDGGGSSVGAAVVSPSASAAALPVIRQLNLSYNSLHIFTGGETLKGLVALDLSRNELTQLQGQSLPSTLVTLNLSHNRLARLEQFAPCVPRLQELNVSHNQVTSAGLRGLPASLTRLHLEGNALESLTPLSSLIHLKHLNVAHNQLESYDVVLPLRPLLSLRYLDLRGNPFPHDPTRSTSDSQDSIDTTRGMRHAQSLLGILNDTLPRLSHLNGKPLSQAPENRKSKSARTSAGAKTAAQRSASTGGDDSTHRGQQCFRNGSNTSASRPPPPPALEVRLMRAKVSELRRLLLAAQDAEAKARQERALLIDNVKSTALVIDQQEAELEKLQADVERLREEEAKLRMPVAAAEQSFEQVHASLLATKAKPRTLRAAKDS